MSLVPTRYRFISGRIWSFHFDTNKNAENTTKTKQKYPHLKFFYFTFMGCSGPKTKSVYALKHKLCTFVSVWNAFVQRHKGQQSGKKKECVWERRKRKVNQVSGKQHIYRIPYTQIHNSFQVEGNNCRQSGCLLAYKMSMYPIFVRSFLLFFKWALQYDAVLAFFTIPPFTTLSANRLLFYLCTAKNSCLVI